MQLHHLSKQHCTREARSSVYDDGPSISVAELCGAEAAEIALLDLAISDEAWLDEDETTEYAPPAVLLDELDGDTLDPLFELEAERMGLADLLEPTPGGFDPLAEARRRWLRDEPLDDPWFGRH